MKSGDEVAIFGPLATHPRAALHVARHVAASKSLKQRKIAPGLAGILGPAAPPSLLDEPLSAELDNQLIPG